MESLLAVNKKFFQKLFDYYTRLRKKIDPSKVIIRTEECRKLLLDHNFDVS